jgi:pentapeptide MXKDX repeat protein
MTNAPRISLLVSAAVISLGLASAPAAFAQDKMGKDAMTGTVKDAMSKDGMKKDDAMSKDAMKKDDAMSKDTMKKDDAMSKDEMKK